MNNWFKPNSIPKVIKVNYKSKCFLIFFILLTMYYIC